MKMIFNFLREKYNSKERVKSKENVFNDSQYTTKIDNGRLVN